MSIVLLQTKNPDQSQIGFWEGASSSALLRAEVELGEQEMLRMWVPKTNYIEGLLQGALSKGKSPLVESAVIEYKL